MGWLGGGGRARDEEGRGGAGMVGIGDGGSGEDATDDDDLDGGAPQFLAEKSVKMVLARSRSGSGNSQRVLGTMPMTMPRMPFRPSCFSALGVMATEEQARRMLCSWACSARRRGRGGRRGGSPLSAEARLRTMRRGSSLKKALNSFGSDGSCGEISADMIG